MSLVYYYNNLAKTATITASTENAQYPASNIKDDRRTKVYRSTSNSDNVVFDFGSAEDVDAVCIAPNWQTGFGFTSITIEANTANVWGSPAFSQAFSFDSTYGTGITELSSTQSYRYWRLVITSSLGYCELANVFIGPKMDITTTGVNSGIRFKVDDLVETRQTEYGQVFIDDITQKKKIENVNYENMNKTEIANFEAFYDYARTVNPFWVRVKNLDSVINDADRYGGIYRFTRVPDIVLSLGGFYSTSFRLEEQK